MDNFSYISIFTHHSLKIHLRIPVWIIKNNHISSGQINPQTSSPGTQHKYEFAAVGSIKGVYCFLKNKKKNWSVEYSNKYSFYDYFV